MRVGIIINELVINSFKYAFDNHATPEINVALKELANQDLELVYQDNGKGLPPETNVNTSDTLGLKLIRLLTKQLNGEVKIKNDDGAVFTFILKLAN